jgi:hypothetical protein
MAQWKELTRLKLDAYTLQARLLPGLFAALPLIVGALAWMGPTSKWASALVAICGGAVTLVFLSAIARDRGKSMERRLWRKWGGAPTTQLLRHRGSANPITRKQWMRALKN